MIKAKFSKGQTVSFDPTGSDETLIAHKGVATIERRLTSAEADIHDVGMMYRVKSADGWSGDAFEDELS